LVVRCSIRSGSVYGSFRSERVPMYRSRRDKRDFIPLPHISSSE
jgi:hypothetical protein